MKGEVNLLNKIAVSTLEAFRQASSLCWYSSSQYTHCSSSSSVVSSVSRHLDIIDHLSNINYSKCMSLLLMAGLLFCLYYNVSFTTEILFFKF